MILCVNHELISSKLKRLAFSQEYVICYEIGFGLDLDFGYVMKLVWPGFGFLVLDLKDHSGYL